MARTQSGGYIAHIGMGVILIGLVGSAMFVQDQTFMVNDKVGTTFHMADYSFKYQGANHATLPNGNTIFCNYLGHGHVGEQPHFFEITRDKQVVWEFSDHTHFKTINQIQLLDVPGDATMGEILR